MYGLSGPVWKLQYETKWGSCHLIKTVLVYIFYDKNSLLELDILSLCITNWKCTNLKGVMVYLYTTETISKYKKPSYPFVLSKQDDTVGRRNRLKANKETVDFVEL